MTRTIIVEDDPMVAQLTAQYLTQMGTLQVDALLGNGREALEYLRDHPVDLAIVDVYMPSLNGLELLRSLRGQGIRTSVIMITAATEMKVVEEALQLGIEDYIIKPFAFPRLRDAVQKYLNKASLVKSSAVADQSVVDQLLSNAFSPDPQRQELRKGLNPKTLHSIESHLAGDPQGAHTCESISAASGLSRVTVRHYLNYLIEIGHLDSSIDYETGGRPRVLYRLK